MASLGDPDSGARAGPAGLLDQLFLLQWLWDIGPLTFPRSRAGGRTRANQVSSRAHTGTAQGQCRGSQAVGGSAKPGSVCKAHHAAPCFAEDTRASLTPPGQAWLPFLLQVCSTQRSRILRTNTRRTRSHHSSRSSRPDRDAGGRMSPF